MNKNKIVAIIMSSFLLTNSMGISVFADTNSIGAYSDVVRKPIVERSISKMNMTATATSSQPGEEASKAIDGNLNSMWHTPWSGSATLPQSITVNLGGSYNVSSLKVTPRQAGDNGKIQEYEIYSGDELVTTGKFDTSSTAKVVRFEKEVSTDNLTIKVTKAVGGFASISEIDVYEKIGETSEIVNSSNIRINNGQGGNINKELEKVKTLQEGTIISRFDVKGSGIQSILGISNNNETAHHFNLWTDGSKVGYEIRNAAGNINGSINAKINPGINTIAFKVEKNVGYSIFLNGEIVKFDASTATKFLNDIPNLNSIDIGKTDRSTGNEYLFTGDVDFLNMYAEAISDDYIIKKTGETIGKELPLPDGAYKSEVKELFKTGDLNASKFRIPSLLTTKEGTIIAGIDVRNDHAGDSPANIDAGVIISKDGGATWTDQKRVIDYPGSASVIDSSLLQDEETGKVFLFITAFPQNYGFPNTQKGTGFETINGEVCMILFDGVGQTGQQGQGNKYYIKPDGKVYTYAGEETAYTVDINNDLYENGVKVANTFLPNSPLKAFGTAYLTIIESTDEGDTWSAPKLISGGLKEDWMKFIGTGPGRGIQIKNGDHAGRLVFPLYYTNENNFQSSATMYSDDNGVTWTLGESPNDTRDGQSQNSDTISSGNQLTEAQVVEMPDGQLKMFMRNTGTYVRISTSFDGGETWESEVVEDTNLREPYCQLSVINYSGLIDGKPAVIFSNPDATNRSNGTVKIGLIEENGQYSNGRTRYSFNWKYKQTVKEGSFGYSALTEMPNGNIGLHYEGDTADVMEFIEMNLEFIKADLLADAASAKISTVTTTDNVESYKAGDKINIKVSFDQVVSLIGNRDLTAVIDGKELPLTIVENKNSKDIIFEGAIPADVTSGEHNVVIKAKTGLDIVNVNGKLTDVSQDIQTDLNIVITTDIVVDKSELEAVINTANDLVEESYTNESFAVFKTALDEAKVILENPEATQAEVTEAKSNLENAISNLEEKVVANGKTSISLPDMINKNNPFDVTIGANDIKAGLNLYAAEMTFTYNPEVFDYNSVASVDKGLMTMGYKVKDGEIKFLVASLGKVIANNSELVKINLTPKKVVNKETLAISVSDFADGEGVIHNFELADKNIKVEENLDDIVVGKAKKLEVEATDKTVTLTWNEPSKAAGLKEYIVYKDGKNIGTVEAGTTEFGVYELKSNTIYGFKVTAKYINGEESKPVSVNVRTKK